MSRGLQQTCRKLRDIRESLRLSQSGRRHTDAIEGRACLRSWEAVDTLVVDFPTYLHSTVSLLFVQPCKDWAAPANLAASSADPSAMYINHRVRCPVPCLTSAAENSVLAWRYIVLTSGIAPMLDAETCPALIDLQHSQK